eukprot:1366464-Amorphochlora_amoeboformis.AAC.1
MKAQKPKNKTAIIPAKIYTWYPPFRVAPISLYIFNNMTQATVPTKSNVTSPATVKSNATHVTPTATTKTNATTGCPTCSMVSRD